MILATKIVILLRFFERVVFHYCGLAWIWYVWFSFCNEMASANQRSNGRRQSKRKSLLSQGCVFLLLHFVSLLGAFDASDVRKLKLKSLDWPARDVGRLAGK